MSVLCECSGFFFFTTLLRFEMVDLLIFFVFLYLFAVFLSLVLMVCERQTINSFGCRAGMEGGVWVGWMDGWID